MDALPFCQAWPITLKCLRRKEPDFPSRTPGDHLRRRRLERELGQKEAAQLLGVTSWTILNWEKGRTDPAIGSVPGLIRFLGYDPSPDAKNLPQCLLAKRRAMGWSIRKAAGELGVDPGAWRDWERGGVILYRAHRNLVARLLNLPVENVDSEMRARWNRSHKGIQFPE